MFGKINGILFVAFFPSIPHTSSLKLQITFDDKSESSLDEYLCFDASSHNLKFGDMVKVWYVHVRMSFSHVCQSVHI